VLACDYPIANHDCSPNRLIEVLPLIAKVLVMFGCLATAAPAFAQGDLKAAPPQLSLLSTHDQPGDACRRVDTLIPAQFAPVRCIAHFTMISTNTRCRMVGGCRTIPERRLAGSALLGGDGSDFKRQTKTNGEQQIYVDPRYTGRATKAIGARPLQGPARHSLDRRQPHPADLKPCCSTM